MVYRQQAESPHTEQNDASVAEAPNSIKAHESPLHPPQGRWVDRYMNGPEAERKRD